jgi:hypothetical protein
MHGPVYFIQGCPTCGRRLQIRVVYLGKKLVCEHCKGQFMAADPANPPGDGADAGNALLRRADELLNGAPRAAEEARSHYPR